MFVNQWLIVDICLKYKYVCTDDLIVDISLKYRYV